MMLPSHTSARGESVSDAVETKPRPIATIKLAHYPSDKENRAFNLT